MPFLLTKTSRSSIFTTNNLLKHFKRCYSLYAIPPRPLSRGSWHPASSFRHGGIQTRYLRAFSSEKDVIPLSPAQKETIYALSTPPGRAGIAVIRISGPEVSQVYGKVVKPTINLRVKTTGGVEDTHSLQTRMPEPWKMHRCSVLDPETKQVLDEGLTVYFAGTPMGRDIFINYTDVIFQFRSKIIYRRGCLRVAYTFWKSDHQRRPGSLVQTSSLSNGRAGRIHQTCFREGPIGSYAGRRTERPDRCRNGRAEKVGSWCCSCEFCLTW